MLKALSSFSGISVNDMDNAKDFYAKILGLEVKNEEMGLTMMLPGGGHLFIYEKDDHEPATYTVLNFVVENIDSAVDGLVKDGATFERYEGFPFEQDEKGIARGLSVNQGPDIAWFKDPAGNILSVLQEK